MAHLLIARAMENAHDFTGREMGGCRMREQSCLLVIIKGSSDEMS